MGSYKIKKRLSERWFIQTLNICIEMSSTLLTVRPWLHIKLHPVTHQAEIKSDPNNSELESSLADL